jgi:3-deoxy-7-phosphoheptulonate synthase
MLIVMKKDHTPAELEAVRARIVAQGWNANVMPGEHSVAVGITGNKGSVSKDLFITLPGVAEAIPVTKPFKLASREFRRQSTEIRVGNVTIGPGQSIIMAGPCAVETREQTLRIARKVKSLGAQILRGGAYKPRTSPYAFQGLGVEGLKILAEARAETGLPIITEALDSKGLAEVYKYADIIQIGARNMQNFSLLQEAGRLDKPICLKRGMSATLEEWLMAAEYILEQGNSQVILCERGVRSYDPHTRNILDLTAVPSIQAMSHLPIIIDPSHSTGRRDRVAPMSLAAVACGAHGLLIDVHDRPQEALCDGPQALLPEEFAELVGKIRAVGRAVGVVAGPEERAP